MATKQRIGMRCYNPYVPNEVWDIFKRDLRKIFKIAFPEQRFSITEFYWRAFSVADEYIRIRPQEGESVDWKKVWAVLDFVANEFGMTVEFIYCEEPVFKTLREDTLFPRKYASYSLKNIRTWTIQELDSFLATHSFETLEAKYHALTQ
jgi:hypothetical protein